MKNRQTRLARIELEALFSPGTLVVQSVNNKEVRCHVTDLSAEAAAGVVIHRSRTVLNKVVLKMGTPVV